MAKARSNGVLDLECTWGNVSLGEKTARLGATIARSALKLAQADKTFCGRRITGKITAKPADEEPDQGRLAGMEGVGISEMEETFDVKGLNVSSTHISLGLTFNIKDLDVACLAHFARRTGRLVVTDVSEIPESENGEDEE